MKAYLSSVDLWLIVSSAMACPAQAGEAQTNWDTADAHAIGIISLTLRPCSLQGPVPCDCGTASSSHSILVPVVDSD
jgi:hypothetical protein